METIVLALFFVVLVLSITLKFSLVIAMFLGLAIFVTYAAIKHYSAKAITKMIFSGIKTSSNILTTFLFIGMMTALWRAAGTIPTIVSYSANLLHPEVMIIMTFLLCSLISFLTGTSCGTAATMGVICASIGMAMNVSPIALSGAILSGAFFGDRCSPVSTSMLLTASLTKTDPYKNIKNMFKTALIPFILTCVFYILIGFFAVPKNVVSNITDVFQEAFVIHPIALIPAIVILVLAIFRVPVKMAMLASIISALPICIFLQRDEITAILKCMVMGFTTENALAAPLINGGGIVSMLKCGVIVCISSAYSGIFQETGLLNGTKKYALILAKKTNAFVAILLTSIVSVMAACNQTLGVMLTNQICDDLVEDKSLLALYFEDTVILISAIIPWSIAATTALDSAGVTHKGILLAVYLFFVPICGIVRSFIPGKVRK